MHVDSLTMIRALAQRVDRLAAAETPSIAELRECTAELQVLLAEAARDEFLEQQGPVDHSAGEQLGPRFVPR